MCVSLILLYSNWYLFEPKCVLFKSGECYHFSYRMFFEYFCFLQNCSWTNHLLRNVTKIRIKYNYRRSEDLNWWSGFRRRSSVLFWRMESYTEVYFFFAARVTSTNVEMIYCIPRGYHRPPFSPTFFQLMIKQCLAQNNTAITKITFVPLNN